MADNQTSNHDDQEDQPSRRRYDKKSALVSNLAGYLSIIFFCYSGIVAGYVTVIKEIEVLKAANSIYKVNLDTDRQDFRNLISNINNTLTDMKKSNTKSRDEFRKLIKENRTEDRAQLEGFEAELEANRYSIIELEYMLRSLSESIKVK